MSLKVFFVAKTDIACLERLCLRSVLLCFVFFFSDVKGHVRVGYLFIAVSVDWEKNQRR